MNWTSLSGQIQKYSAKLYKEKVLTFHKGLEIARYQNPVTAPGVTFVICKEAAQGSQVGGAIP